MGGIFRGFENNLRVMGGFYVVKMKKDPKTGQYVGVAQWVRRDEPLAGSRVTAESKWPQNNQTPKLEIRSDPQPAPVSTPQTSNDLNSSSREAGEREQSNGGYRSATDTDFSRFADDKEEKVTEPMKKKSNFYDPYDSYDL
ncbi:MAG: hypothetical protein OK439_02665 [Thaumarchaeota archaeon]|nr:hypothetical protein [Nitrososphaerota archaeon]